MFHSNALSKKDGDQGMMIFLQVAGVTRGLNRHQFPQILIHLKPSLQYDSSLKILSDMIFTQIDANNSGLVNEYEFMAAYPKLKQHLGV